jgi:hypothetical protein
MRPATTPVVLLLVVSTSAHAAGPTWVRGVASPVPAVQARLPAAAVPRLRSSTDGAGTSVPQGRSHWLTGALIGLAVGAGATYLVLHSGGSTSLCNRSENQDALNGGECAGLTAAGGLVGAGIGALVGAQFHSAPDAQARLDGARGTGVARAARPGWQLRLRLAF